MPVTTTHTQRVYTSTGVELAWAVDMQVLDPTHLVVKKGVTGFETTLVLGVDYTVDPISTPLPGTTTVRTTAIVTAGDKLSITRSTPQTQEATVSLAGGFDPAVIQQMADKQTLCLQEIVAGQTFSGAAHGNLGGGSLHALVVRGNQTVPGSGTPGFLGGDEFDRFKDHVEVTAGNPHGVTAAGINAAPLSHVGTGGSEHPVATQTNPGFMSDVDKARLDAISVTADPRNVHSFDDFFGPGLDTTKWTRTLTATNPVASVLTSEYGVYRELTDAGSASSGVLLRSTAKGPATKRGVTFEARLALGAQGAVQTNCLLKFGLWADPTVAVDYAYFDWNGTNLVCRSRGATTEQFTSVATQDTNMHVYKIVCTASKIEFYIDGGLVATHTTNVPTSTVGLERFFDFRNTASNARSLDIDYEFLTSTRAYT